MGRSPVHCILACIIILACMWTDTVGQESGPACTTNAVFEYCLSQQGLNVTQNKAVLCSVDHDTFQSCESENRWNCSFDSPIWESGLSPYFDLLRECTFQDSSSCLSSPCLNGGTCTNVGSFQRCSCPFGFYGNECQETSGQNSSSCLSAPCLNGGTCTNFGPFQRCSCPFGFHGNKCQETSGQDDTKPNFDPGSPPCSSIFCQNGGTCINHAGTEICLCSVGYRGGNCEIPETPRTPGVTDSPCDDCGGKNGNPDGFGIGVMDNPCVDCGRKNENSDGLGIDAIAGIAIGAVAAVLLFAILLAVLFKRKHRKPDSTQPGIPLSTAQPTRVPKDDNRHPSVSANEHPSDISPKSKSNTPVIQFLPTDDSRQTSVTITDDPLRWEEDYVTPVPSETHHHTQSQTSEGYLEPVTQDSDALVYDGVHVYSEIDEN